jgi:predicted MFS family arabinose efflux permease
VIWAFYALVSISVKTTVWTAPVSGQFLAGRGVALALVLSGTAAAQAIFAPFVQLANRALWLAQRLCLDGLGWGAVTLLLCWLFLYDRKDRARVAKDPASSARATDDPPGLTIAEAWRSRPLWAIAVSTFVMMLLSLGLQIHQVPILTGAGVSRANAAWLASLFGVAGIVGKLITGALLDRYRPNWIGGLTLAANSLAFLLLLDGMRTPGLIVAAIVINGYSAGTKLQICTYLTASYAVCATWARYSGRCTASSRSAAGLGRSSPGSSTT